MDWLDFVPLVAALATMAVALVLLTAGTEAARRLVEILLQITIALGLDGDERAMNYTKEL